MKNANAKVIDMFDNAFTQELALHGKNLGDTHELSARMLKAAKENALKQCVAELSVEQTLLIEQNQLSLEQNRLAMEDLAIQAAQMGMDLTLDIPAAVASAKNGITDAELLQLRAMLSGDHPVLNQTSTTAVFRPTATVAAMATKTFNIGKTFGVKAPKNFELTVENHTPGHPLVPETNKDYIFPSETLINLSCFLQMEERFLYIFGPTGCGKSSLIEGAAAILGVALFPLTGHDRMESPELIGGYKLNSSGGMHWVDGPLTSAIRAGAWFLLDEIDQVPASTLVGLNRIVESTSRSFLIEATGELVKIPATFRFLATGNSNGAGDATGLYQGVTRMSLAFMDRAVKLEFGYAKHDVEVSILQKAVPSLPQDVLEKMVDLANAVRRQFMAGDMEITMSTRSLIRWARIFVHDDQVFSGNKKNTGRNLLVDALDKTVGFQAEDTTKESLHLLCQSHFG